MRCRFRPTTDHNSRARVVSASPSCWQVSECRIRGRQDGNRADSEEREKMTPIMDSTQVADLLKCSVRTVEDNARAGRLPAVKFGDGWMFPTDALLRAVNRLAEEEAVKRQQPAAPKAVGTSMPKEKRTRPNLALLAQAVP